MKIMKWTQMKNSISLIKDMFSQTARKILYDKIEQTNHIVKGGSKIELYQSIMSL